MGQHRQVEKRRRPIFYFPFSAKSFKVTANVMAQYASNASRISTYNFSPRGSISFVGAKCTPWLIFSHMKKCMHSMLIVDNVAIGIVVIWHPQLACSQAHNAEGCEQTSERSRPPEQKTAAFWKTFALCFSLRTPCSIQFSAPLLFSEFRRERAKRRCFLEKLSARG